MYSTSCFFNCLLSLSVLVASTRARSCDRARLILSFTSFSFSASAAGEGVKLCQPVLWKPFGWWRVDVDIVGYATRESENNGGEATSVLLPVATPAQVRLALSRVLPGFAVEQIPMQGVPRRARWFRWFESPQIRI